ncbi:hypothetical protein CMO92_02415 [Candidatus Woesearchaeota archaeon]|nr:hypothetical protein [Candidatus Woesearchaeota archaeon]
MGKISIDTPLAELTLRKYEKPETYTGRDLVRKFCLSIGLLQPGDSRDVIVDILLVMLEHQTSMNSKEIEDATIKKRKELKLPLLGIAPSNIRRQLLRLRDHFILEKIKNTYRFTENTSLTEIFSEKLEKYYLTSILARIKEYVKALDKTFPKDTK